MDDRNNDDKAPSQPLLPLNPLGNGNNNFRSGIGFNNFGGLGTTNNENSRFKFVDPNKDLDVKSIIERKLRVGTELSEDELLAAEKFPGIKKLLDKLKELNRQKELEKQKEKENNNEGLPNINNDGENNGNSNTGNDADGDKEEGKGEIMWIQLKKKKFLFQAQPVRPENEIVEEPEVVYYLN